MHTILDTICDRELSYQQRYALARDAEATLDVLPIPDAARDLLERGVICDLFEVTLPGVRATSFPITDASCVRVPISCASAPAP